MKFVIASKSPRRKELFSLTGWDAEVFPTDIPETRAASEAADEYVRRLAAQKAAFAAASSLDPAVILAADTIVTLDGVLMEKPLDAQDAASMLKRLRGRTHQVCTAFTVIDSSSGKSAHCACITDVPMRNYSDLEVDRYVAGGSPLDKAGAYGIQDRDFHPVAVENLQGCFANVMGLPLCHLSVQLQKYGVPMSGDIAAACQKYNHYNCPVHASILGGEPCVEPQP